MNYLNKLGIVILLLLLLTSCTSKKKEIYFYHWNTNFQLSATKQALLDTLKSDKIYTKFFDVTYVGGGESLPKATLQIEDKEILGTKELVPVVYITNEVFKNMKNSTEVEQLARNISDKIGRLLAFYELKVNELQFDCDWSMATRANYFLFLEAIKQQASYAEIGNPKLSATIRLHQVKYKEKTGIPPVDRGVIMFYNVGEVTSLEETNSILNLKTVDTYVSFLAEYPLDYDIAVPLFSWAVVFNQGKLRQLITKMDLASLQQLQKEGNYYNADEGGVYVGDSYLYEDDKVRYETVDAESLAALASRIKKYAAQDFNLIYYHINSKVSDNFSAKDIQQLSDKF
ncbi:MAG: hypothetical protein AAF617_08925 [Bacteroidota bacterium]